MSSSLNLPAVFTRKTTIPAEPWSDNQNPGQYQDLSATRLASILKDVAEALGGAEAVLNGGGLLESKNGGFFQSIGISFPGGNVFDLEVLDNSTSLWAGNDSIFGGFVGAQKLGTAVDQSWPAFFTVDRANTFTSIPFENTAAVDYYVGFTVMAKPLTSGANPLTGVYEYTSEEHRVGVRFTPDTVTDTGTGLKLKFPAGEAFLGDRSLAGRTAYVWLETPVAESGTAIELATITWSGTANEITVGYLGQSPASTTPSDYRVFLVGPVVSDLIPAGANGFIPIGTITGGVSPSADISAQGQMPNLYRLAKETLELAGPNTEGFRYKVRVRTGAGAPASEAQVSVDNAAGTRVFAALADGTTEIGDVGTAVGPLLSLLATAANWSLQNNGGKLSISHDGAGLLVIDLNSSGGGTVELRLEGQDIKAYGSGAMRFDDDNTSTPIPLSDGTYTALPSGASSILGALGLTSLVIDTVLRQGCVSAAAASDVTQPSGNDVDIAALDYLYDGSVKSIPADTVTIPGADARYHVYLDTSTGTYTYTTTQATAWNTDDIPVAVVDIVGGVVDYFIPVLVYVQQQPDEAILVTPHSDSLGNFHGGWEAAEWMANRADVGLAFPKTVHFRGAVTAGWRKTQLDARHNGTRWLGVAQISADSHLVATGLDGPIFEFDTTSGGLQGIEIGGFAAEVVTISTPHTNDISFFRCTGGGYVAGLRIHDCIVNFLGAGCDPNSAIHIEASILTDTMIERNSFVGGKLRDNGIFIDGPCSSDYGPFAIRENVLSGSVSGKIGTPALVGGICLENSSGNPSEDVVIENNTISGFAGHGIAAGAVHRARILDNNVEGLVSDGSTASLIYLELNNGVSIDDCVVARNLLYGTSLTGTAVYGIRLNDAACAHVKIEDNLVDLPDTVGLTGIYAVGEQGIVISGNTLTQQAGTASDEQQGIVCGLDGGASVGAIPAVIRGNLLQGFWVSIANEAVIRYGHSTGPEIPGARIEENRVIDFKGGYGILNRLGVAEHLTVANNHIKMRDGATQAIGIGMAAGPDCIIEGNTVDRSANTHADTAGIDITDSDYCVVHGNHLISASGTTGYAILADSLYCVISQNICRGWEYGVKSAGSPSSSDSNSIQGNVCHSCDYGIYWRGDGNVIQGNVVVATVEGIRLQHGDANVISGNRALSSGAGATDHAISLNSATADNNVFSGNSADANGGNGIDTATGAGGNNVSANYGNSIATNGGDEIAGANIN
jgi:parallel beta-helix repeat protein